LKVQNIPHLSSFRVKPVAHIYFFRDMSTSYEEISRMSVERRLGLMSQKNISKANWSHYGSIRPQATRVTTTVTMAASTAADVLRRRWCRLMVSVRLERPDEARANADHHVAAITCRVRSPSRIGLGPILFLLYITNLLNVTGCPSRLCRHSNLRLLSAE